MDIHTEEEQCLYNIQQAIEVLGGKWSFLVLGQLFCHDVQRFNQLRRTLKQISTKSLRDTLRHLEENQIVKRPCFPPYP